MTPLWWRLLTILPVDFPVLKTNMTGRSTNYVFTKMLRDVKQPKRENTASFFTIKPSSFAPWLLLSNPASHKTVESDSRVGSPSKVTEQLPMAVNASVAVAIWNEPSIITVGRCPGFKHYTSPGVSWSSFQRALRGSGNTFWMDTKDAVGSLRIACGLTRTRKSSFLTMSDLVD